MQILLVTNYRRDKQKSMVRFGNLLVKGSPNNNLKISEVYPRSIIRKYINDGKLKKWAGYIDKYILFQKKIKSVLTSGVHDLIHIIDHSNSVYLPIFSQITNAPKLITCHDLIAIRTALGEFPNAPQTSRTGKRLQRWIYKSLVQADYHACDSLQTEQDLNRLVPGSELNSSVLHLGTETNFPTAEQQKEIPDNLMFCPGKTNFLLHVGSSAWYKNRKAVFKAFRHSCEKFSSLDLKLILVGPKPEIEELDTDLSNWFRSHPKSLINLNNLSENSLSKLYKYAMALVCPSYIEGFGWPPLEAAVHGCPVITTRTGAISDLLSNYAHYVDADVQATINKAVIQTLEYPDPKKSSISLPNHDDCRNGYYDLYNRMIKI
jgi:glycosyltransferase involved in cell wall biosynthesis